MKPPSEMSQVELIALIMKQSETIEALKATVRTLHAKAYPVEDDDYIDPVRGYAAWKGEQERQES